MRIDCKEYIDLIEEKWGDKKDYFRNSYDFLLSSIDRGKQIAAHLEKYVSLKDKKCLDMGCLDGGVSIGIAQQGANVTGVEINKDCLHRAKILNNFYKSNCVFELRDCLNTNFEDDYFDIVICTDVIEHVASHDSLMREISRILRKQGFLYIPESCTDIKEIR